MEPIFSCISLLFMFFHSGVGDLENFRRTAVLANYYQLSWEVDFTTKNVTFEVKANTTGFVGFGLNTIGGMKGADIVAGGVYPNGTWYFSDRHGLGNYLPTEDRNQDWLLLDANEVNGWTTLKFTRGFFPCDSDEDIQLTNGTLKVIYSVGQTDELSYHGSRRGVKSLILLSPPGPAVDLSNFQSFTSKVNTLIPAEDTTYWVTVHKTPRFEKKAHLIAFSTDLTDPLAQQYNHHLVFFKCTERPGMNMSEVLEPWVGHPGGPLDDPQMLSLRNLCSLVYYVWAKGGSPLLLPEHVGLPIGGEGSEYEYFLLEFHYDNPNKDAGVQYETGVTMYYTYDLRPNDAAILMTGITVSPGNIVPPQTSGFIHTGHCSAECTKSMIPEEGINAFSVFLHAHLNGRAIKVRHFRGEKELPWLTYDNNYDFDYQQDRQLREEVKILPGDHISVECTYDTTWRNPASATYGGESSRHEMCQAFILAYPGKFSACFSSFSVEDALRPLGVQKINWTADTVADPIIDAPAELRGMTLMDALNTKVNWTADVKANLQKQLIYGDMFMDTCGQLQQPITNYPNVPAYEPEDICSSEEVSTTSSAPTALTTKPPVETPAPPLETTTSGNKSQISMTGNAFDVATLIQNNTWYISNATVNIIVNNNNYVVNNASGH